ncbi:hypothetical protein LINPERHAP2_LOCUS32417, partial [Linum perenne]
MTCRPGFMLSNFFIDTYEQCTNILFKQSGFCDRFIFGTHCASMCINKAFNISEALEFIQGKAWTTDMDWEKVDYVSNTNYQKQLFSYTLLLLYVNVSAHFRNTLSQWFFPLCYKEHFVVFCVNLKKRCGDYLDSLDREEVPAIYQRTSSYIMELANTLIPMFRSNPPPEPIDVDNWVNHRGVRQPDKTSCGIFALNMLEMWEGAVTPDILSW